MPNWTKVAIQFNGDNSDIKNLIHNFWKYFEETRFGRVFEFDIKNEGQFILKCEVAYGMLRSECRKIKKDFPNLSFMISAIGDGWDWVKSYDTNYPDSKCEPNIEDTDSEDEDEDEDNNVVNHTNEDKDDDWLKTYVEKSFEEQFDMEVKHSMLQTTAKMAFSSMTDCIYIRHFPLIEDKDFMDKMNENFTFPVVFYGINPETKQYKFIYRNWNWECAYDEIKFGGKKNIITMFEKIRKQEIKQIKQTQKKA